MYQNSKIRQGFRQHYDEANFSETMDTIICKELQQANHISTEKTESNGQAGYWREAPWMLRTFGLCLDVATSNLVGAFPEFINQSSIPMHIILGNKGPSICNIDHWRFHDCSINQWMSLCVYYRPIKIPMHVQFVQWIFEHYANMIVPLLADKWMTSDSASWKFVWSRDLKQCG